MVFAPIFSGITFHVPDCFFTCSPSLADAFLKRGGRLTMSPFGVMYGAMLPSSHSCLSCTTREAAGPLSGSATENSDPTFTLHPRTNLHSHPASTISPFLASPCWSTRIPSFCRSARIPVLYDRWVQACMEAEMLLPLNELRYDLHPGYSYSSLVVYDPFMFEDICFTTTQLPRFVKHNVMALLLFYGAHYSKDLTEDTDMLVYFRLHYSPPRDVPSSLDTSADSRSASGTAVEGTVNHTSPSRLASCLASSPSVVSGPSIENGEEGSTGEEVGPRNGAMEEPCKTPSSTARSTPSPPQQGLRCPPMNEKVASHCLFPPSPKLQAAIEQQMLCVTPGWVQQCVFTGRLLEFPSLSFSSSTVPAPPSCASASAKGHVSLETEEEGVTSLTRMSSTMTSTGLSGSCASVEEHHPSEAVPSPNMLATPLASSVSWRNMETEEEERKVEGCHGCSLTSLPSSSCFPSTALLSSFTFSISDHTSCTSSTLPTIASSTLSSSLEREISATPLSLTPPPWKYNGFYEGGDVAMPTVWERRLTGTIVGSSSSQTKRKKKKNERKKKKTTIIDPKARGEATMYPQKSTLQLLLQHPQTTNVGASASPIRLRKDREKFPPRPSRSFMLSAVQASER